jgi:hypothetical protein
MTSSVSFHRRAQGGTTQAALGGGLGELSTRRRRGVGWMGKVSVLEGGGMLGDWRQWRRALQPGTAVKARSAAECALGGAAAAAAAESRRRQSWKI